MRSFMNILSLVQSFCFMFTDAVFFLLKVPENLIAVNGKQMRSIDVVTAILDHMISRIKLYYDSKVYHLK